MAFLTQVSSPAGIHLHFPASDDHQFHFVQLQKNPPLGTPLKPFQNSVLYSWHLEMTAADSLFPVRPLCILVTLRCLPCISKVFKANYRVEFPLLLLQKHPRKISEMSLSTKSYHASANRESEHLGIFFEHKRS